MRGFKSSTAYRWLFCHVAFTLLPIDSPPKLKGNEGKGQPSCAWRANWQGTHIIERRVGEPSVLPSQ